MKRFLLTLIFLAAMASKVMATGAIVVVDGVKYAQTVAGIIAALGDPQCASGNCEILLPTATYSAANATTITVSQPNIWILGAGAGTIVTTPAGGSPGSEKDIFEATSAATGFHISNMTIQGQATSQSTEQCGIEVDGNNAEIDHIVFSGSGSGDALNIEVIVGTNTNGYNIHDNRDDRSPIGTTSSMGYGVLTIYSSNGHIHHNTFNWTGSQGRHCIYLSQQNSYVEVDNNTCTGGTNIQIQLNALDSQGTGNTYNNVHDNILYGSTSSTGGAIAVVNNAMFNKIGHNLISGPTQAHGIAVWDAQGGAAAHTPDHTDVIGNTVVDAGLDGILVIGANDTLIQGNKIYNASQHSSDSYNNIYVGGDGGTDTTKGTRVLSNFSFCASSGTLPAYSLLIGSNAPKPTGTQVIGNSFDTCASGITLDQGTGTVQKYNNYD